MSRAPSRKACRPKGYANGRYRDGLFDKVPGAKALYIGEIGYRGRADLGERSSWYRAGAIYNTSQYQIFDGTGRKGDNHAFYAVADIQLTQSSPAVRQLGWYANLRGNYAPPDRNFYTGDLSAALYKVGTFEARLLRQYRPCANRQPDLHSATKARNRRVADHDDGVLGRRGLGHRPWDCAGTGRRRGQGGACRAASISAMPRNGRRRTAQRRRLARFPSCAMWSASMVAA